MLNRGQVLMQALGRIGRAAATIRTLAGLSGLLLAGQAAHADASPRLLPLLAQETAAEGGYPIIEWAIVVVLIGAAVFVICRSSRRN